MDQKQLKTSWQMRVLFGVIAFLMLFSTVAVYALIVISNSNSKKADTATSEEVAKLNEQLEAKKKEVDGIASQLSAKYYETMLGYRANVKPYNAKSVDNAGLKQIDLKEGDGEEIKEDSSYYSYYIGWCADESVFDIINQAMPLYIERMDLYMKSCGNTSFIDSEWNIEEETNQFLHYRNLLLVSLSDLSYLSGLPIE